MEKLLINDKPIQNSFQRQSNKITVTRFCHGCVSAVWAWGKILVLLYDILFLRLHCYLRHSEFNPSFNALYYVVMLFFYCAFILKNVKIL